MIDPLQDIHHYSPALTIAQVIKFCEKKALPLSRPMVQNYIRDGLLPPPLNKRIYTHKHLAALVMICRLKTVYDMPAIKAVLEPHMDDDGLPLTTYKWLISKLKEVLDLWLANIAPNITAEDESRHALLIMAHAADIKDLAEL